MDYDNILRVIGEFGRYQRKVYVLLNALSFFQCFQMFLLVFVAAKPTWRCGQVDEKVLTEKNQDYPCFKNGSACQDITFDKEFSSVISEWNLVCNQEYKANMAQSVMFFGCLIGVISGGRISDQIGRRPVTLVSQLVTFLLGLLTAFVQSYTQFLVLRFLVGLFITGGSMSAFVIMTEIIGPSYRGRVMMLSQMFYALGFGLLSMFAYEIRDWRHLTTAVSLPGILYMFLISKSIPESPRWLLAEGRISEAEEILGKIAKKNGTTFDDQCLTRTKNTQQNATNKNYGILTLLTHKSIRVKIVILMLIWLITSMVYYGLSFYSKNMQGDRYWNFFLSGFVEIPSYFLALPMVDRIGRQKSLFICMMVGSLGCLASAYGPVNYTTMTASTGKFGVSAAFAILYIYSAELIPTVVRNFAMGTCSMTARFGGILAPLIVTLAVTDQRLPMLVFAGSGIFAALIGLFLPETLNCPVPETLDESDHETQETVTIL